MFQKMQYITEMLHTPISGSYDVIVCGGGPSGVGAAVTSARKGLKTLLIERYGFLGGMWTAALVNPFFDTEHKDGLVREIVDELKGAGAFGAFRDITFDYETLKQLLDRKVREAGADILFHTYISKPYMEDGRVSGIVVENKGGRQCFQAKVVIDCTGDGDVAAAAGAAFIYGDGAGRAQDMTTMFLLGNVSYLQEEPQELYHMMKKACDENDTGYNIDFDKPYVIKLPIGNYAVVQLVHIRGVNALDPFALSKAETDGRQKASEAFRLFKKYIPEFKNADLIMTAPQIGIRETRHIVGEEMLTGKDIYNGGCDGQRGDFSVYFNVDIHNGEEQEVKAVQPYRIPYGCLRPKGIKGLLVAGRCISADYEAHASFRVTGNCVAIGEMAATLAYQEINS